MISVYAAPGISLVNPSGVVTAINTYNNLGQVIRQTVPRQDGSRAAYEFFFSGFRNIEQDPDSGQLVYYFDRRGRGTGEENELGQQRSRRYDGSGRTAATHRYVAASCFVVPCMPPFGFLA